MEGVLKDINDKKSVIKKINSKTYQELLDAEIVTEGMLPKLENCFDALKKGVHKVNMGNTSMLTNENETLQQSHYNMSIEKLSASAIYF